MTDQTRADFEAHFGLTTRQAWTHPDGSYKFPEIQAKWEGYMAGVAKAAPHLYIDALTAARDFLASGKRDGEARLAVLCQIGTALTAAKDAPVAAAAPAAEQKPVRYELRMCAEGQCDDWKPVSKERYETLTANGGDAGDGLKFEGRALYAAPVAAAAPGADDRDRRIAELEAALRSVLNQPETPAAYDAMMQRVTDALAAAAPVAVPDDAKEESQVGNFGDSGSEQVRQWVRNLPLPKY